MARPRAPRRVSRPLVIAHRGASGYETENSRAAFRAAARLGADAVELDVHATTDGALVVYHDDTLDGERPIRDLTAAVVRRHRLANGEPVPTLAVALDAIAALGAFVELKGLPPAADERLLATLADGPNPAGYAVHSFDHRIIHRLGAGRPDLRRGVLSASYPLHPLEALRAAGAATLWQDAGLIDAALVDAVHDADARIIAWTANRDAEILRLARLGVDGLATNYPDRARRVVDALGA